MRKILLLIAFVLTAVVSMAEGIIGHYKVRHLTASDGLPGNTVRDIQQDGNGFLWMAGTGGLARFDGYRFVSFNHFGHNAELGVPRHIGRLYMAPDKSRLWLSTATYNNGCYDLLRGRFVDYTGCGDYEHPYRKLIYTHSGVWMISNTDGLRHVCVKDGEYVTTDYSVQNHKLPGNRVRNIAEDSKGNIWASTDKGLVRIDSNGHVRVMLKGKPLMGCYAYGNLVMAYQKESHTAYVYNSDGSLRYRSVLPMAMGHIGAVRGNINWRGKWYIFTSEESFALDCKTGQWTKPLDYQIPNGSLCADIDGMQFVANQSGSLWMFPNKGKVRRLELMPEVMRTRDRNTMFSIAKGNDDQYYIGSYGSGLFVYDYGTDKVSQYTADDRNPLIFSNYVLYVTTDRSGCIWVSTESGGVSCLTRTNNMAEYYLIDDTQQGQWTNNIIQIWQQADNDLLVETRWNKRYVMSAATSSFRFLDASKNAVSGSVVDKEGRVLTATRGGGILVDGKQLPLYANSKKEVETMDYTEIVKDKYGNIWLGSLGQGLFLIKKIKSDRILAQQVIARQYNESRINDIAATADGRLYVASLNGLYAMDIQDYSGRRDTPKGVVLYNIGGGNFPADEINCICPASNGIVWVGTTGGGLVRCDFSHGLDNMTYKSFTVREGLSNDNIQSLVVDRKGYLWIGTEEGLSRLDPKDNYIRRCDLTNNVLCNTFSRACALLLRNGNLAFGTANGVVIVNPALLPTEHDASAAPPLISDILINGTSIYEGMDSVITDRALVSTKKVSLSFNENSLTFYFSSCNYRDISSQSYQYYLKGVDKKWRPVTGDNHAEYSNLSPGTYEFHVRTVTSHGPGSETILKVHIRQPWYNSVWAWMVYILIAVLVAYFIYRNSRERFEMHQQIKLEKQVAEFRTNFFTHVTHEFRTPLAILQNAVERLSQPGVSSRKDLQTAQRGIRRLLRLVNQFLEYRRIETGKLKLSVYRDDIVTFVQDIFHDFYAMSEQKHLTLSFTPFAKHYEVSFDHRLVESVIYNLISNAVKYTPENGSVSFYVRHDEAAHTLLLVVEDTGNGIAGAQLADLFRPFMEGNVSRSGMGIGLYTSYRMAQIHHGSLDYADATPHGARFTFTLPDNDEAYSPDEYGTSAPVQQESKDDAHYQEVIKEMAPKALNDQRVAIIEDDPDMQEQIVREVGAYFQTSAYSTGKDALQGIEGDKPSLILCDIMLPDMNGYQIVSKLKENENLRDVPVIMLTALNDESHQIKGYQVGADDYMVKPCNYHLLIARMMQLIKWHENRQIEQRTAEAKAQTDTPVVPGAPVNGSEQPAILLTSRADKRFREQLEALVLRHIDDQELSVDRLAEMMSMGRTKFYGRVKELFGMSPNKYIMQQRMEYAAQLLADGDDNVSEVSYKVGFSDPTYFNKCFKAHFGMAPSKYKRL